MDDFTKNHLKQYLSSKYRNYELIYPLFANYLESLDKDEQDYYLRNGWNVLVYAIENSNHAKELSQLEFND